MSKGADGDTNYVDLERIRRHGLSIYYWMLSDFLKLDVDGVLSF